MTIPRKATSIRYGDVNIGRHDGYFAAIRPNSSYVPYEAALEQLMVLPNGTYTLSAYVYSVTTEEDKENGGYAKMYVYEDDGLEAIEVDLEATGAWTQVVIPDVTITNGKWPHRFRPEIRGLGRRNRARPGGR